MRIKMDAFVKRAKTTADADTSHGVPGLALCEEFITGNEERALLTAIDASAWDTTLSRRTQHYGYRYDYKSRQATAEPVAPIPDWCTFVVDRLLSQGILAQRPDQVIINEYQPGQGIAPHTDSTTAFADGIVSISLGSAISMDLTKLGPIAKGTKEVMLYRRSALSLHGDARYLWRHGIAFRLKDGKIPRQRRVSLTFRRTLAQPEEPPTRDDPIPTPQ